MLAFSIGSFAIPLGTFFENQNKAAAATNNNPTPTYNNTTLLSSNALICSSETDAAVPNKANATTIGPMVVPKELIPPPRFTLLAPVFGSPNKMANGLAAVCCNEKPKATMNNPTNIPAYILASTAIIMAPAPSAENSNP